MIGQAPENSESDPHSESSERDRVDKPLAPAEMPREIGGRAGLEPTRYGDWEKNGRCIDF